MKHGYFLLICKLIINRYQTFRQKRLITGVKFFTAHSINDFNSFHKGNILTLRLKIGHLIRGAPLFEQYTFFSCKFIQKSDLNFSYDSWNVAYMLQFLEFICSQNWLRIPPPQQLHSLPPCLTQKTKRQCQMSYQPTQTPLVPLNAAQGLS